MQTNPQPQACFFPSVVDAYGMFTNNFTGLLLALLTAQSLMAADPPTNAPPIKATLIAVRDAYELNPAMAGEDFVKRATDRKNRVPLPKPPAVDLTLRLTNTSTEAQTLTIGGDESRVDLRLAGEGAVNISPGLATTMEFRMGKPVVIPAGGQHEIPIKSLASGNRGVGQYSYWTKPGEYLLHATFNCRVGKKPLKLTAEPLKLKVTEPAK
jgi:hypothetical protein